MSLSENPTEAALREPFDPGELKALCMPLPRELQLLKSAGRFDELRRRIGAQLAAGWPDGLYRSRLRLELLILDRLEADYTLTRPQLCGSLRAVLTSFDESELVRAEDDGLADWIFLNGEQRFLDRSVQSLLIQYPGLAARLRTPSGGGEAAAEKARMCAEMERRGGLALHMRVRHELRLLPGAVRPGKLLRVQLPLPVDCSQTGDFRLLAVSHPEAGIGAGTDAQRTLLLTAAAGDRFWAEYEFTMREDYLPLYELAGTAQDTGPAEPAVFGPCLSKQLPHIAFTPYLRLLADEICRQAPTPALKARAIYDWITRRVRYGYQPSYFTFASLAEQTARSQRGDCGMQALLFITLCRLCGIPARWQSGRSVTPCAGTTSCHDWARVYLAPWGWRGVDCSAGGGAARAGDEGQRRFFFGSLTPARIPLASGFQQPLSFETRFIRDDPYDNQQGEAEYEDEGLPCGSIEAGALLSGCKEL